MPHHQELMILILVLMEIYLVFKLHLNLKLIQEEIHMVQEPKEKEQDQIDQDL